MKILIGMSGGLDSTVAAKMLLDEGHCVEGAFIHMGDFTKEEGIAVANAVKAADSVGIKLNIIDAVCEFKDRVIKDFLDEYSKGRTPNPCVECNRHVKVKLLCDYAKENGFDKVTTGHYAGVVFENGRYSIVKGADSRKDQSYMLWQLTQEQLSMLYFPLFVKEKDEIRTIAEKDNLHVANLKESQDICFIPDGDYIGYIEKAIGKFPDGDFVDEHGNKVGRHKGIIRYTIGQRKGLGISLGKPVFVSGIDPKTNTVKVLEGGKEYTDSCCVKDLVFQSLYETSCMQTELFVKVRYGAVPVKAAVKIEDRIATVTFASPVRAVTPGQSCVCYDGEKIAFGGKIV